jgi:CO dehydrogenase maturation factor
MKIAIVGKGGVGKTTISGALCRIFARQGKKVIAIDADPNPNLSTILGLKAGSPQPKALSTDILERVEDPQGNRLIKVRTPIEDILAQYGQKTADDVTLLIVGKPEVAGSGCMCGSHTTVRELVHTALSDNKDSVTIVDMEASLEHMKRGTSQYVDVMLVIVEPYYRSLEAAMRFVVLANDLGIKHITVIANKVTTQQEEGAIRQFCSRNKLTLELILPYNDQVKAADLHGESFVDYSGQNPVIQSLEKFAAGLSAN